MEIQNAIPHFPSNKLENVLLKRKENKKWEKSEFSSRMDMWDNVKNNIDVIVLTDEIP